MIIHLFILLCFLFDSSKVSSFRHPSFLSDDEINHHLRVERSDNASSKSEIPPCNEDDLISFLAEIQVIYPETIVKLATVRELDSSCTKLSANLAKINDYLKTCKPPNQPELYYQLVKGVQTLYNKLCTDNPFRTKYYKVHGCLHELRNDFDDCGGPPDWNENSDNAAICKAYKEIVDCYYIKTAKVCGNEAASVCKELLESIIDSILTVKCDNIKTNPEVKDPMPPDYIKKHADSANDKKQLPSKSSRRKTLLYHLVILKLLVDMI